MTDDEARKLAQRMIDAWPNGPKAYIWRDLFIDLDANYAAVTYRTLIRVGERAPTTGVFMAHYSAALPSSGGRSWTPPPDAISLGEYLERVQLRATNGDHEAQAEMDRWARHLSGNRKGAA